MADEEQRLSFKEMCTRFDVTPRTLRYYEYIELLSPDREGRARFYRPRDVARMTLILRGRNWGFSLEDIRQWLLIYDKEGTEAQTRAWISLADRQIEALEQERIRLGEAIASLRRTRDESVRALSGGCGGSN